MIRWRDVQGYDIVATDDAQTIGRVATLVVDVDAHAVRGIGLDRDRRIAPWDALAPLSGDVVTIPGTGRLTEPADESAGVDPTGMPVFSDVGDALGDVTDLELDEESGVISTIVVGDDRLDAARLRGLGDFAVVVRSESSSPTASRSPARSRSDASRLEDRTKDDLYQMAREQNVRGRSSMTKAQLVDALRGSG